jgi:hypothetical protein
MPACGPYFSLNLALLLCPFAEPASAAAPAAAAVKKLRRIMALALPGIPALSQVST